MARAIWNGSLNFGLVTIPVKLFSAVSSKELHFNFLHDKDRGRITNIRTCSECGKKVDWDHIVRGYEYEKGKYVVMTDEDFKRVNVEATQSVDILEFVNISEIDPALFDTPYYLEPEKKGRHAYALLRDALMQSKKVGIARVVIRSREHLSAVRPRGQALMLELMHFADEIVDPEEFTFPKRERDSAAEMKTALMLINTMAAKFKPEAFKDKYRDELLAMIEARARGKAPARKKAKLPRRAEVTDIISALEESLRETRKHRRGAKARA